MSLRFLSDQCVPAEITDILRKHGHQVTFLREVLPIRSPDPVVIGKAHLDQSFYHRKLLIVEVHRIRIRQ